MHLKKVVKKEGKFFIRHYVIVDASDGSTICYEELDIRNLWRYIPEIIYYLRR